MSADGRFLPKPAPERGGRLFRQSPRQLVQKNAADAFGEEQVSRRRDVPLPVGGLSRWGAASRSRSRVVRDARGNVAFVLTQRTLAAGWEEGGQPREMDRTRDWMSLARADIFLGRSVGGHPWRSLLSFRYGSRAGTVRNSLIRGQSRKVVPIVHAVALLKAKMLTTVGPIAVLTGDERHLKRAAVERLVKDVLGDDEDSLGLTRFPGDDADLKTVCDELLTVSMWGDRRLVIVDGADKFVSQYRDGLEKYLARPQRNQSSSSMSKAGPKRRA